MPIVENLTKQELKPLFVSSDAGKRILIDCYEKEIALPFVSKFKEVFYLGEETEGLKNVKNLWEKIDSVDIIFFPNDNPVQNYLIKKGYKVIGVGKASELSDIWELRKHQNKSGLPMPNTLRLKEQEYQIYKKGIKNWVKEQFDNYQDIIAIEKLNKIMREFRNFNEYYYLGKQEERLARLSQEFLNGAEKTERYSNNYWILEDKIEGEEKEYKGIQVDGVFQFLTEEKPPKMLTDNVSAFLKDYIPTTSFITIKYIEKEKPYLMSVDFNPIMELAEQMADVILKSFEKPENKLIPKKKKLFEKI